MAKRPEILTISFGREHEERRAALLSLAAALGFDRNISALLRWLADTFIAAPDEMTALMEAARDRATGGDEWSTLVILRDLLPPIALAAGDRLLTIEQVAAAVRANGEARKE